MPRFFGLTKPPAAASKHVAFQTFKNGRPVTVIVARKHADEVLDAFRHDNEPEEAQR